MQETQTQSLHQEDPWRRKWQPTPVFLPGESHGGRSLVGQSMGSQRVGHNWVTSLHFTSLELNLIGPGLQITKGQGATENVTHSASQKYTNFVIFIQWQFHFLSVNLIAFYIQLAHMLTKSLQSCATLCDSIDCSQPGSSVYGILQARILEWVAISSYRGSS